MAQLPQLVALCEAQLMHEDSFVYQAALNALAAAANVAPASVLQRLTALLLPSTDGDAVVLPTARKRLATAEECRERSGGGAGGAGGEGGEGGEGVEVEADGGEGAPRSRRRVLPTGDPRDGAGPSPNAHHGGGGGGASPPGGRGGCAARTKRRAANGGAGRPGPKSCLWLSLAGARWIGLPTNGTAGERRRPCAVVGEQRGSVGVAACFAGYDEEVHGRGKF